MSKILCKITLLLLALAVITPPVHACNQAAGYGFTIAPVIEFEGNPEFVTFEFLSGIGISGTFVSGDSGFAGSTSSFSGTTNSSGELTELGKASPAHWNLSLSGGVCNGQSGTVDLRASSSAQLWVCEQSPADDFSVSPSSFDVSGGATQTTITMTAGSAWPATPYYWADYGPAGNLDQTGYVGGVTDSYDCWGYMTPYQDSGGSTHTIVLEDSNGNGIGYGTITVTDGSGG